MRWCNHEMRYDEMGLSFGSYKLILVFEFQESNGLSFVIKTGNRIPTPSPPRAPLSLSPEPIAGSRDLPFETLPLSSASVPAHGSLASPRSTRRIQLARPQRGPAKSDEAKQGTGDPSLARLCLEHDGSRSFDVAEPDFQSISKPITGRRHGSVG